MKTIICILQPAVLTSCSCGSERIVYSRLRHLQSAVSKSNVNVNLLQTYANAKKTLVCEGKGVETK